MTGLSETGPHAGDRDKRCTPDQLTDEDALNVFFQSDGSASAKLRKTLLYFTAEGKASDYDLIE